MQGGAAKVRVSAVHVPSGAMPVTSMLAQLFTFFGFCSKSLATSLPLPAVSIMSVCVIEVAIVVASDPAATPTSSETAWLFAPDPVPQPAMQSERARAPDAAKNLLFT
jgi:hypothetical protein